jgi:hypothetical protein
LENIFTTQRLDHESHGLFATLTAAASENDGSEIEPSRVRNFSDKKASAEGDGGELIPYRLFISDRSMAHAICVSLCAGGFSITSYRQSIRFLVG